MAISCRAADGASNTRDAGKLRNKLDRKLCATGGYEAERRTAGTKQAQSRRTAGIWLAKMPGVSICSNIAVLPTLENFKRLTHSIENQRFCDVKSRINRRRAAVNCKESVDIERISRHGVEVSKVGILTGSDTVIEMHDIWKTYPDGTTALQSINVVIDRNEFVYVVGTSGAGKSTFMKLIYREEVPTKGQISVNGFNIGKLKQRKIPFVRRNIGVIFQDYRLLPKMSAYENVAFAMEVIEAPRRTIKRRTMEVLDLVGLKHKAGSLPAQLSGGEQQRVAIARAIVNSPAVIVADEPTGNLDPETSWGIMKLLEEINFRGTTIVMATHNKEIVNTMRKRVLAMERGSIVRDEQRGDYGYEI